MKIVKTFIVFLALLFVFACSSSKVSVSSDFSKINSRLIAVLPIKNTEDLRDSRVEVLEQFLKTELKVRGFNLLEDSVVKRICPQTVCPDSKQLFSSYGIFALVQLEVESFNKNNFGLGYYNSLAGKIVFLDSENKELLTVVRSEKEKGGVIFQSGQIIQGLSEQFKNSADEAFAQLAERFVHEIVQGIPSNKETSPTLNQANQLILELASMQEINPDLFKICANANKDSIVSLLLKKEKIKLSKNANGQFCRILRLSPELLESGNAYLEARSFFGDSIRKEIQFNLTSVCMPEEIINIEDNSLNVKCEIDKNYNWQCGTKEKSCSLKKLLVYHSDNEIGPYAKYLEVKNVKNEKFIKKQGLKKYLQIIAIGRAEDYSLPYTPDIK